MTTKSTNVQLSLDSLYQINGTIALHVQDLLNDPLPGETDQARFTLFAKTDWTPDQETREASKAFRAVMADFVNFLDKAIFFKQCAVQPLEISPLPKSMSAGELTVYLQGQVDERILAIARDQRLTNPKKLAEFEEGLDDWARATTSGYFSLRRCLEHHFQRPDKDIEFLVRVPTVRAGDQDLGPGDSVESGAMITLLPTVRMRIFPANQPVQLKAQDVVDAAVTLIQVINPQIVEYVRRIRDERKPEQGGVT